MMNPMMGMMPGMGMGMGMPLHPALQSANGQPTHIHHHFGDMDKDHHFGGEHHPKINIYTNPKRVPVPPPTTAKPTSVPTPKAVPLIQIKENDDDDANDDNIHVESDDAPIIPPPPKKKRISRSHRRRHRRIKRKRKRK